MAAVTILNGNRIKRMCGIMQGPAQGKMYVKIMLMLSLVRPHK